MLSIAFVNLRFLRFFVAILSCCVIYALFNCMNLFFYCYLTCLFEIEGK